KSQRGRSVEAGFRDGVGEAADAELAAVGDVQLVGVFARDVDHRLGEIDAENARGTMLRVGETKAAGAAADVEHRLARERLELLDRQVEAAADNAAPDIVDEARDRTFVVVVDGVEALRI